MDPLEAFDEIMKYLRATWPPPSPAPLYLALLRAADEMAAHSGYRQLEEQIPTVRREDVAFLRECMSDLGMA